MHSLIQKIRLENIYSFAIGYRGKTPPELTQQRNTIYFPLPTPGLSGNKINYLKKFFWGYKTDYAACGSHRYELEMILKRSWVKSTTEEL